MSCIDLYFDTCLCLQEEKTVFCPKHKPGYADRKNASDFRVPRIVHLELETKKKQKWFDLRSVRIYIGSLQVEQLGYLHPTASDSTDKLVPVGFSCSRYYWSTRDPTRIVRYNCRTKLVVPEVGEEEEQLCEGSHIVIDHSTSKPDVVESQLSEFHRKCRLIELRRAKKLIRRSNILPPVFVSSLWKHLRYRDLHPEVFEVERDDRKAEKSTPKKQVICSNKIVPASNTFSSNRSSDIFPSPTKRLNKAVGNIFERTPTKNLIDNDPTDLLNLDLGDLDDDRDLISSILSDDNLVDSALNSSTKDFEFCVVKTWFNMVTFPLF
jgi:hypothetical protein